MTTLNPTLTATLDPAGFVELVVTCENALQCTITRSTPTGSRGVRGAFNANIETGVLIVGDYEIPQAETYTYTATVTDGTTTVSTGSETIAGLDRGGDYIAAVGAPFSGTNITVESLTEEELRSQQDIVNVLGRSDPVVVTYGRTWMRAELVLLSLTEAERNALENIFEGGRLILFSPRIGVGYDDLLFLAAGDVTVQRVSRIAHEPARRWTISVQKVVAPPPTFSIPIGSSWQQRKDANSTWSYWSTTASWLEFAGVA